MVKIWTDCLEDMVLSLFGTATDRAYSVKRCSVCVCVCVCVCVRARACVHTFAPPPPSPPPSFTPIHCSIYPNTKCRAFIVFLYPTSNSLRAKLRAFGCWPSRQTSVSPFWRALIMTDVVDGALKTNHLSVLAPGKGGGGSQQGGGVGRGGGG